MEASVETQPEVVSREERHRLAQGATLIGAVVNIILAVGKVFAGLMGNSAAMLADGIHSLSDLLTDLIVLVAMRVARKGADDDHPYGHGKFETIATQMISLILLLVACGIGYDAIHRLGNPDLTPPTLIALVAAFISLVAKEVLFQYTYRLGKRINAKALIANAWHHRSDAISSIASLLGIGGAMYGWPIMDPLAAIFVALILGKVGVDLFRGAVWELTDSTQAMDQDMHDKISNHFNDLPEVLSTHCLTPRVSGPDVVLDVHVEVNPFLSVSEGHQIAEKVRLHLIQEIESISEVMVHVDTEDDQHGTAVRHISRERLLTGIKKCLAFRPAIRAVSHLIPHYLPQGIVLDLAVEAEEGYDLAEIQSQAQALCGDIQTEIKDVVDVRISLVLFKKWRGFSKIGA